jgi:hypothetical protein
MRWDERDATPRFVTVPGVAVADGPDLAAALASLAGVAPGDLVALPPVKAGHQVHLRWARTARGAPVLGDGVRLVATDGRIGAAFVQLTRIGALPAPLPGEMVLPLPLVGDAVDAPGPSTRVRPLLVTEGRGPAGLYTHFWGADAPFSDLWGPPDVIASWLRLFADWATHCASTLHPADPTRCTPQVGDLGWFGPARPDPLGHKDHIDGRCLDLRLFRVDGSRYEAFWDRPDDRPGRGTAYDGPTTRAFVAFAAARPEVGPVFFNDPAAAGAQALPGHDDHIHLCVRAAP